MGRGRNREKEGDQVGHAGPYGLQGGFGFYPSEVEGSEQRRNRPDLGAHRRPLVAAERTGESLPPT